MMTERLDVIMKGAQVPEEHILFVAGMTEVFFDEVFKLSASGLYYQRTERHLKAPGTMYYIAYAGRTPVGYCLDMNLADLKGEHEQKREQEIRTLLRKANSSLEIQPGSREITLFAVSPDYQGNGVGRKMLERAIKTCERRRVPQLYAFCWKGEHGQSYRLFTSMGFQTIGSYRYKTGNHGIAVVKQL